MFEFLDLFVLLLPLGASVWLAVAPERHRPLGYWLLVAFGVLLLVGPGGCAVFFLGATAVETLQNGRPDPYYEAILIVAGGSLIVAAGGFFIARFALRRLRAAKGGTDAG
jgi:hypothetical protein